MVLQNKIAKIRTIALGLEVFGAAVNRKPDTNGIVILTGASATGKSYCASYLANTFKALYVEIASIFTKKDVLKALAHSAGLSTKGKTATDLVLDVIGPYVRKRNKPVIIDQAEILIEKGSLKLIRDIYNVSKQVACMLVVQEDSQADIEKVPQVLGRIFDTVHTLRPNLADAKQLVPFYSPLVKMEEDLLQRFLDESDGSISLLTTNMAFCQEDALKQKKQVMDLEMWLKTGRGFFKPNFK